MQKRQQHTYEFKNLNTSYFYTSCVVPYYTQDTIPDDRLEFGYGESGTPIEAYAIFKNGQVLYFN